MRRAGGMGSFPGGLDLVGRWREGAGRHALERELVEDFLKRLAACLAAHDAKRYSSPQDSENHARAWQMIGSIGVGSPQREPALYVAAVGTIDAQSSDMADQPPDVDAIGALNAGLEHLIAALRIVLVMDKQRLKGAIEQPIGLCLTRRSGFSIASSFSRRCRAVV
jgi:hypothetical protein